MEHIQRSKGLSQNKGDESRFDSVLEIEVVFATDTEQRIIQLQVPEHTTARQAIQISGLQSVFPTFNFQSATIGVYGIVVPDDYVLANLDRVEIYRPLVQLPTEARRKRAKKKMPDAKKRVNSLQ